MKIVKLIFGAALVALLIVVAAATIFLLTFDANENKQSIADLVKEQTGRELVLDGDVGFSIFPQITITLGSAQLSNAEGFTADVFAQVEKVMASVELLPLFIGNIQIDTIKLQGLQVNLETKASGKTNWDDLAISESDASKTKQAGSAEGLAISIGGIQINDAQVHYVNHKTRATLRIDLIELETGALGRGDETHIHSVMQVQQDDTRLEMVLDTQAHTDFANKRYQLEDLELNMTVHMAGLPDGQIGLHMTADGGADLKQESISLDPFVLTL
ncbi:AsmA family protein, partial [Gammaproteobacteria bacterium]|nr:AsmA family protein [Gammaproteobacteria bacterium]